MDRDKLIKLIESRNKTESELKKTHQSIDDAIVKKNYYEKVNFRM